MGGEPQIVRRRPEPVGRLKLGLLLHGTATVSQSGHQVRLEPEQMALYDPALPYDIQLDQRWSFLVLTFPRDGLSLPSNFVRRAMRQTHPFSAGPGAVLAGFAAAALRQCGLDGTCATRLGEAGLHLIAGALATTTPDDGTATADTQRQQVLEYARKHLSEADLTHDRVAAAYRMAPRTLHRLFEHEPHTVTEYIRLQRLEAARRDLAAPMLSHLSIARVAARWQFSSQAHFTRAFQARFGVAPSTVRVSSLSSDHPRAGS
ncbi:helix-turn-helix domain-containing protein [Actinoplanes sp. TRM 88003]|uniref:Helix-turn-helix domain-containing protein n=1 Tax=Paractinoplanes aksuensis TaxID=2939490 RepID=A0ABT1DXQ3_9ACTN|nr:helix-turn-helix domain-containing protein [Actinoplanes aksuensis]